METFEKALLGFFSLTLIVLLAVVIYDVEAKNKRHLQTLEAAKSGKVQLNLDLGYKIK